MFRAVGFKPAAVTEVIEHIGFQIQAEWLEYLVLHTDTQVNGPLITWLDVTLQSVRRVGCYDIFLIKRTMDWHLECHTTGCISIEATFSPYTIGQS